MQQLKVFSRITLDEYQKKLKKCQGEQIYKLSLQFAKFLCPSYANITAQELQNFQNITDFYLHVQGFDNHQADEEKQFGQSIKHLKSVKKLLIAADDNVSVNFLKGLREGLSQLRLVTQLSIYLINVRNLDYETYVDLIESFKELQYLKVLKIFHRIGVRWSHTKIIGYQLQYLRQLTKLSLSFPSDHIDKEGFQSLFSGLQNLVNLISLNLSFQSDPISSEEFNQLAISFGYLKKLLKLKFRFNQNRIENDGCLNLSQGIVKLKQLQTLKLTFQSTNLITSKGIIDIGKAIEQLNLLTKLYFTVSSIQIDNEVSKPLSDGFQKLKLLKQFQIYFYCQNSQYLTHISTSIFQMQNLVELELYIQESSTNLLGLKKLNEALQQLSNLQKLSLQFVGSKIEDQGFESLANSFGYLHKLKQLILEFENYELTYQNINLICTGIKSNKHIYELQLHFINSMIISQGVKKLAEMFQYLPNLKILFLSLKSNNIDEQTALNSFDKPRNIFRFLISRYKF